MEELADAVKGGGLAGLQRIHIQGDSIDAISLDMIIGMLAGCPALQYVETLPKPFLKGDGIVVYDVFSYTAF